MQSEIHLNAPRRYTTILGVGDVLRAERQTLKIIVREEGFRKMWKGITMNWIKGPISMGISFACYEVIERLFGVTKLQNSSVCLEYIGLPVDRNWSLPITCPSPPWSPASRDECGNGRSSSEQARRASQSESSAHASETTK